MSDDAQVIVRLAKRDLPVNTMRRVTYPPYDVLAVNVEGAYHAIEDACPHSGQSLSCGTLSGMSVVCAGHDWSVCLRTGRVLVPPMDAGNPVFEVRDEGEFVAILAPR